MKIKLLSILLLTFFSVSIFNAQIADGSTAPNFTATDQFGVTHTLQDYINQGKSVIIDVSATWCGPCWSYHQAHVLKDLYNAYGPDGSDEIMVFFVEGDASTTTADLNGTGSNTTGDWVTGTPYPILDDASIASAYQIAFYPTVFRVCPNGLVYEEGQSDVSTIVSSLSTNCSQTLTGITNHGALHDGELALCNTDGSPEFEISNYGTNDITSATVILNENGSQIASTSYSGTIGQFATGNVTFSSMTVNTSSTYTASMTDINGSNPANNNNTTAGLSTVSANASEENVTVNFFTDYYPGETSWEILSSTGSVVASGGPYTPGTADQWGGGGADANTTMASTHTLAANECFSVKLIDSYGDGQQYGTGTNPNGGFGIQIVDGTGEVFNWNPGAGFATVERDAAAKTGAPTSISENFYGSLNIYPNPVNEIATITFEAENSSRALIEVLNSIGQKVKFQDLGVISGEQLIHLNVSDLPSGYYFVNITMNNKAYNTRITVNR